MSDLYFDDTRDWKKNNKKAYVYEIMQRKGVIRKFYFLTAKKLNNFRNKTLEHSKKYIMPDSSNELFGIREGIYTKYIDFNAPYAPVVTTLEYYGCKEDEAFFKNEEYWKKAKENVEIKRRSGELPPKGVNQTDWNKMSAKKKKQTTKEYYG